jgi:large subunit ribosomal protein L25
VKIGHLEVGKSVRVEEVKIDKVRILNNADDTIVSVVMSRALRQAEQEAAAAKK